MAVTVNAITSLYHHPRWSKSAGLRPMLMLHGHGGSHMQAVQGASMGDILPVLANKGWMIWCQDQDSPYTWPASSTMTKADEAYQSLRSLLGFVDGSPIDIIAWSGGGGIALNWIKRNPTKVRRAWLFNPLTDLDFVHSTAGYVPSYSTAPYPGPLPNNASWTSELNEMFPNWADSSGYRIRDEPAAWRGGAVRIHISAASDDTIIPGAAAPDFVAAVNDPLVTIRNPAPVGGHVPSFNAIPASEVLSFFNGEF